ncbi:MAG: uracil-DNA glycosylase [Thermoplasmatota archaeon]
MDLEELNSNIRHCTRCRLSETRNNVLCGEGDIDARVMLVAQAPGEEEDKKGVMFVGPSGKVLDDLLDRADVSRDEIYMTNLIKCMLPDYRKPKQDEIEICSRYLDKEIEMIEPDILVPLGYYASRYLFDKNGLDFEDKFVDLTGKLYLTDERKIYPIAHPASLLYDDSFEEEMKENYEKLKTFLEPCKWYDLCPMKRFYEEDQLDRRWIEFYCKGDWENCVRYKKEKKGEHHPDNMLPDGSIDEDL